MTDFNLNNQYNNILLQGGAEKQGGYVSQNHQLAQNGAQPNFAQNTAVPNMQGSIPAMQGVDYDQFKAQLDAKANDNIVAQAVNKDEEWLPLPIYAKNYLLSVLFSIGATTGTNYLMKSKDIAQGATSLQNFQQTRMYKMGNWLDNTFVGKFFKGANDRTKSFFSWLGRYTPDTIKRTGQQIKIGGYAIPDKPGMFSLGKGGEAMNEAMEFLSNVPEAEIKRLGLGANQSKVLSVLKRLKAGKIKGVDAYKLIGKYFDDIPAHKLAKLSAGEASWFGKMCTTKPNILLALQKAKFFNPATNTTQGPFAKVIQKFVSMVGEASGGGVLGGTGALLMNTIAIITGFNAASHAEKGDKLKAFMEDYIGLTIGGYFMSFIVGSWFNKFLGVAELGLDKNAVKAVGEKLGLDMTTPRLQNVVEAYNKDYKKFKGLSEIAEQYRNGKISLDKAIGKASKFNIKIDPAKKSSIEFLNIVDKELLGKSETYFEGLRKQIKGAFRSQVTLSSVTKGNAYNKGSFMKRLGTYLWEKPLSLIGRAMSIGRYDMIHGSRFAPKTILKAAKRWGFGFGRAIFVMMVLTEPFRKGSMKLSHLIFGKPKNSQLDEEERDKKAEQQKAQAEQIQKMQAMIAAQQAAKQQQIAQVRANQKPVNVKQLKNTNMLKQAVENPAGIAGAGAIGAASMNEKINEDNLPEIKRTYIPSPMPAQAALEQDPREAAVERALRRADAAEKAALDFLH